MKYCINTTLTAEAAHKVCVWILLQQLLATEVCLHPEISQAMIERSHIQLPKQQKDALLTKILKKHPSSNTPISANLFSTVSNYYHTAKAITPTFNDCSAQL